MQNVTIKPYHPYVLTACGSQAKPPLVREEVWVAVASGKIYLNSFECPGRVFTGTFLAAMATPYISENKYRF